VTFREFKVQTNSRSRINEVLKVGENGSRSMVVWNYRLRTTHCYRYCGEFRRG